MAPACSAQRSMSIRIKPSQREGLGVSTSWGSGDDFVFLRKVLGEIQPGYT